MSMSSVAQYMTSAPPADKKYDFVFTKGVLIHQNPELLPTAYDILYQNSWRYIMLCEYYNPCIVQKRLCWGNDDEVF